MNKIKKIYDYLKKDTWDSWIVSLVLILIFIKLIFFPLLAFAMGTPLPLVVVESCSMYHQSSFDSWIRNNSEYYESKSISKEDFSNFPLKTGLNKGDIIIIWGHSKVNIGDIIVFNAKVKHPLIHRIISLNPISTKGDNNSDQLSIEKNISKEDILGKSIIKIPFVGWIKLIFFEPFRKTGRGFC